MERLTGLSHRFGTLRWRLTFSYFMTAFVALLILEGTFVGIPSLNALIHPPALHPIEMVMGLENLAPEAAPYISRTSPDLSGLRGWLQTPKDPVASYASGVAVDKESTFSVIPGGNALLLVANLNNQIIARLPPSAGAGNLAALESMPELHTLIAAAETGQNNPARLVYSLPDGRAIVAVPIKDTAGAVHGALVVGADLPVLQRAEAISGLSGLIFGVIPFALIASILGALIGLLTARGLTRRIRGLTSAADGWSKGDFAITVQDKSTDELGQLASDLNRMAEQLQNLLRDRQQLAVLEERNRLARDLHDSVKQQVFAVKMLVSSAQLEEGINPEAKRVLGEAERISSDAQQELTALIHALRPVALTGKGLSPALRELCTDWPLQTGIATTVEISDGLSLSPAAEGEVYRTVQEVLANIARHSGATQAEVSAAAERGWLRLCIADNGHGFNVALASERGIGLRSIRERIEGLGGTLLLSSTPEGTRVEVSLPMTTAATMPSL
jgi:two-component system, NarL family, sensor histidine kinase LiaS